MMKKNMLVFMAWLCMAVTLLVPMRADASQKGNIIQDVQIYEDEMQLLCVDESGSGSYEVELDGQTVPSTHENVDVAQMPVTVFCLVDTSGSISEFKMKLLQDTLMELSNSMDAEDSMVVATIDNQLNIGEALYTTEEREAAIAGITSSHKDTDLYMGIVESLDRLASDETYNPCRCLVVLSDGIDDQDDGMTEQEVQQAVQDARLPVYTVALVQNPEEREGAKVLGSFARNSFGGLHLTTVDEGVDKPIRSDVSGEEFGKNIWASLMTTAVLHVDLTETEIDTTKSDVRLRVTYKTENISCEDFVDIHTSEFSATEDPNIDEPEKDEEEEEDNLLLWLILAAAAVVVIIIVIVIVILVKKKKHKEIPEEIDEYTEEAYVMPEIPEAKVEVVQEKAAPIVPEVKKESAKPYNVYLTDIPYGTRKMSFVIYENKQATFGRDKRAMNILNAEDLQLSGLHFSLMVKNGIYGVRDENSSNGTFLNGVSISGRGWTKLQSTDKIRAGGYEYRIVIEE